MSGDPGGTEHQQGPPILVTHLTELLVGHALIPAPRSYLGSIGL